MTARVFWYSPPSTVLHNPGPLHPERAARARAAEEALTSLGSLLQRQPSEPLQASWLTLAHTQEAADRIVAARGQARTVFDPDTQASAATFEAVVASSGALCAATEAVIDARADSSFVVARPPGHHATRDRSMGFCFANHIAIAARHAQQNRRIKRVAIVDYDVHHGNGTQDIFYQDPNVLFASLHQFPHYPGSGLLEEVGSGEGAGTTLNLPLPAHSGGADYRAAFERVLMPKLTQFAPELVLVSAGFDAHEADPLGDMKLVANDFAWMSHTLMRFCQQRSLPGPVFTLEGGYDLPALAQSLCAVATTLATGECPPNNEAAAPTATVCRLLDGARSVHKLESTL